MFLCPARLSGMGVSLVATVICHFEAVVKPVWNPKAPVNLTSLVTLSTRLRLVFCPVKQELCQPEVEASEKIADRTQKRELMAQLFAAICNVKEWLHFSNLTDSISGLHIQY